MKILIALDDSPHSDRALHFVTRMRWPAGSRVVVLSALRPEAALLGVGQEPTAVATTMVEEQRRKLEEVLAVAESRLRESGFTTESKVLLGDPREALLQAAHSERADLLVVGSHGRT